MTEIMF